MCIHYDYVHGIDVVQFIQLDSWIQSEKSAIKNMIITSTQWKTLVIFCFFFYLCHFKKRFIVRHFLFNAVCNFCRLSNGKKWIFPFQKFPWIIYSVFVSVLYTWAVLLLRGRDTWKCWQSIFWCIKEWWEINQQFLNANSEKFDEKNELGKFN